MKSSLILLCLAVHLAAQQPPEGGQRPPQMSYDSARELTLQGTVSSVRAQSQGPGKMVSITLQTVGKAYEIMVAPASVLNARGFGLASGDELTVLCAPAGRGYLARQISRGSESLTLLDESGKPTGGPQGPPER